MLPSQPCSVIGGLLLALGLAAATASWCSLAAPMHCVSAGLLALIACACCRLLARWCLPPQVALAGVRQYQYSRLIDHHSPLQTLSAVHWRDAGAAAAANPGGVGLCRAPKRALAARRPRPNLHPTSHPGMDGRAQQPGGRGGGPVAGPASGGGCTGEHLCLLPCAAAAPLVRDGAVGSGSCGTQLWAAKHSSPADLLLHP